MLYIKDDEIITVKVITDWGWWYKVGEIYIVKKYPYMATKEATLNYCHCSDCCKNRAGKKLYAMYEVVTGEHQGAIIPVDAVEIVAK